ncbi:MAG: hypothetical protein CL441_03450 [Acidimicrobiaceae bacterium]|nr:hypothetical protein [Acidimicrobiaceae bacterium]
MAILVDDAIWPWRGRRWAHLVSDAAYGELHAFASDLGLRRMAFQGDHYDVPAEVREKALVLGAEAVEGRELLRRLKASGLRLPPGRRPGSWVELGVWRDIAAAGEADVPAGVLLALEGVSTDGEIDEVSAWRRGDEHALAVSSSGRLRVGEVPIGVEHRLTDGGRHLELLAGC